MTAEVAVMNSSAIALAADSAVTLGSGKIYNSVNKLFKLSKYHPVGIMVYSSADIMRFPVETVIKVFRERLGNSPKDTVEDYCTAFIDFLETESEMFTQEQRMEHYAAHAENLMYVMNRFVREAFSHLLEKGAVTETQLAESASSTVEQHHKWLMDQPFVDGGNQETLKLFRTAAESKRDYYASIVFGTLPVNDEAKDHLVDIASAVFAKAIPLASYTGVVIAGFGHKEYMPRLRSFHFFGSALGVTRIERQRNVDINSTTIADVIPFAQADMVRAFMDGISPDFMSYINEAIQTEFAGLIAISDTSSDSAESKKAVKDGIQVLEKTILEAIDKRRAAYGFEQHYWPIIQTVASLPKDELAKMAEALVNLTSLKRRVTNVQETVGGPVDVAIITKGDGFVWTQRKHYFDASKNPHFVHNYFRDDPPTA